MASLFRCADCQAGWLVEHWNEVFLCPKCLAEIPSSGVDLEDPTDYRMLSFRELLDLQRDAWTKVEERFKHPHPPLDAGHIDTLLQGPKVEGVLDPQTGRFYLDAILLPDGSKLLLSTKQGRPCIFQHERP